MKRSLFVLALLLSSAAEAQKISLKKGQQITITTSTTQDVDMMAMGLQMKSSMGSTSTIDATGADNENIITSYKTVKLNLSIDAMGQQINYDSDKPEDRDSEMGKNVADKLNKEVVVLLNKNTGKASLQDTAAKSPEKPDATNPLAGIMDSFGSAAEDAIVETAFLIIPAGKKKGDTWMDSTIKEKMKDVRTYTLKSINNGLATISLASKMEGSSSMESQGMQMDISLSSVSVGDVIVDTKTALVKKRSSTTDLTGSMEVMGQSIPMTSKAVMTIEYK